MTIVLPQSARLLPIALLALAITPPEASAQDNYPNRIVRVIVPTAPSGGSDTIARLIAQGLFERWGRQVVVDNRAGASTIIGSEMVARAAPDGHTLLLGATPLAINPATFRKLPYDALRDFAPITMAAIAPSLLIVHPSVPAKSVKEMITLAKQRPGEIMYASAGFGTNNHLAMELFASMAHARMIHVPYKGAGPGIIALLAGQVALSVTPMLAAMPHVRSGRVRALGVTSTSRISSAPDTPTIAEAGLPGYESVQWYGLLAPAGTPSEIIARLNRDTVSILTAPANRERITGDGADVVAGSPQEFATFIRAETVKWARVAAAAGIQPE